MNYQELQSLSIGDTVRDTVSNKTGEVRLIVCGSSLNESEIHAGHDEDGLSLFPDELEIVSVKVSNYPGHLGWDGIQHLDL